MSSALPPLLYAVRKHIIERLSHISQRYALLKVLDHRPLNFLERILSLRHMLEVQHYPPGGGCRTSF